MTCTVPAEWLTIVSVPDEVRPADEEVGDGAPAAKLAVELPVVAVESALRNAGRPG